MGPALPEGGVAQLPVDDIPGWFFATNGYFSLPMKGLEGFFAMVHDVTGAPWWASIMLSTLMIRGALLPLIVVQQRNVAGMAKIKPQLDDLGARLKEAYARESIELANKLQSQMNTLMTENNVRPFSTMLGALVQIPLWMTFFFTLRGILARTNDPHGFAQGGALWFPDLTVADPYYILPVVTGGTFFAMASVDLMGTGGPVDEKQQMMKTGMKAVALLMIPMTASFESGVFVYWTTSNIMTVAQGQVLKNTQVRALIGMPPMMVPLPEGVTAAKYAAAPAEIVVPTQLFTRPPGLALADMPGKKQRPHGQRKKKRR
jgi:YidC/Oxa1 family membrane protein insertase